MVPYVAPIATALLGKSVGDTVEVMHGEAEIVAIE
jgi:transcription elongation GreA/GreB family factor